MERILTDDEIEREWNAVYSPPGKAADMNERLYGWLNSLPISPHLNFARRIERLVLQRLAVKNGP